MLKKQCERTFIYIAKSSLNKEQRNRDEKIKSRKDCALTLLLHDVGDKDGSRIATLSDRFSSELIIYSEITMACPYGHAPTQSRERVSQYTVVLNSGTFSEDISE